MSITAHAALARSMGKRIQEMHEAEKNQPMTGAELVTYWQREGVIGSRADIKDSQSYAQQLRIEAENRIFE